MSTKLINAAGAIAQNLVAVERATDAMLLSCLNINTALVETHDVKEVRFINGQGAMTDFTEAQALVMKARFHVARAHQRLADEATSFGIDWRMFGDEFDTPPPPPSTGALIEAERVVA